MYVSVDSAVVPVMSTSATNDGRDTLGATRNDITGLGTPAGDLFRLATWVQPLRLCGAASTSSVQRQRASSADDDVDRVEA